MKIANTLLFFVACTLSSTAWSQAGAGLRGTFTTIDAPGATAGPNEGTVVSGFSQSGATIGYAFDAAGQLQGFLRTHDGQFVTFEDPDVNPGPLPGTIPYGVNANDDIVGIYSVDDSQYLFTSFLRTRSGAFSDIHAPGAVPIGTIDTWAYAIDSRGDITGQVALPDGTYQGFVRLHNGTFAEFNAYGAMDTYPYSISDAGAITGVYDDASYAVHGFVRAPNGVITNFDAPGAGTGLGQGTNPTLIYPGGAIVGSLIDSSSVTHGFVRAPNGTIKVVDISGAVSTIVSGVTGGGEIVGTWTDAEGVNHGFIRTRNGVDHPLNVPAAGTASGEGTNIVGITGDGVIVGDYTDSGFSDHGFLWRPADE